MPRSNRLLNGTGHGVSSLVLRSLRRAALAVWSPILAPPATTRSEILCVFLLCLGLQVATIYTMFSLAPEFIVSEVSRLSPAQLPREQPSRQEIDQRLTTRARQLSTDRTARGAMDTIVLTCFWFACGQWLKRNRQWRTATLGLVVMAILGALIWLLGEPHGHPALAFFAVFGTLVAMTVFLEYRGESVIPTLDAVVMAAITVTLAFVLRCGLSVVLGRDPGAFTLSRPGWAPWMSRIDLVTLWWCGVVSGGLARVWERSYVAVLAMTSGVSMIYMWLFNGG